MAKTGAVQETSSAIEAGATLAARRAERMAAREAEEAAERGRRQLPAEELQHRFAATVTLVLEALDAFLAAAGINIEAAPASAIQLELRGAVGDERLRLRRVDDALVVLSRGVSRSIEYPVDLSAAAYSPADVASAITAEWIALLTRADEARHA